MDLTLTRFCCPFGENSVFLNLEGGAVPRLLQPEPPSRAWAQQPVRGLASPSTRRPRRRGPAQRSPEVSVELGEPAGSALAPPEWESPPRRPQVHHVSCEPANLGVFLLLGLPHALLSLPCASATQMSVTLRSDGC